MKCCWQLGILQVIHALDFSYQIKLFAWMRPVKNTGTPDFVQDKIISEWSDTSQHFNYGEFSVDSLQLLLLNHKSGRPTGNHPISKICRIEIDGGIQFSFEVSDVFHPKVPHPICSNSSHLEIF